MSLPYFNLYPRDFEADTSHLSLEEDGAYNRLLRLCWMTPGCSLPDDDAWIMRRLRVDLDTYERVVAPVISEFFETKGGRVLSARLMKEFKKVDETSRKRSMAGKKGGRPKAIENIDKDEKPGFSDDKAGLYDTRAFPEPEPEPDIFGSNEPQSARDETEKPDDWFDRFWEAYPLKRGKPAAKKSWVKAIKKADPEVIISAARRYAQSRDVQRGFAKYPQGWLTDERWADAPDGNEPQDSGYYGGHRVRPTWDTVFR